MWSNKCPLDCQEVRDCVILYNTVETCLSVAETGETLNGYKIITRDSDGNYLGVDHYEWFDFTPTTGFTVSEPTIPCDCCDGICAKPFVPTRRCFLYTNLGSSYTFGAGGFLQDPSIFDDPCPQPPFTPLDCAGFDFRCTNLYPVQVVFEDAAISSDGGITWTHFSPNTITYNSPADVTYSDEGYGLGWDGLANAINPFIRPFDIQLRPNAGNRGVWEFSNGANETTHIVTVSWRWELTGGFCEGVDGLDSYELAWAQEWQATSTLGQSYGNSDGLSAASGFNVETTNVADFTAPIDSCETI